MELGKLPTERVEDIKIAEQRKLTVILFLLLAHFSCISVHAHNYLHVLLRYAAISQKTQVQALLCFLLSHNGETC